MLKDFFFHKGLLPILPVSAQHLCRWCIEEQSLRSTPNCLKSSFQMVERNTWTEQTSSMLTADSRFKCSQLVGWFSWSCTLWPPQNSSLFHLRATAAVASLASLPSLASGSPAVVVPFWWESTDNWLTHDPHGCLGVHRLLILLPGATAKYHVEKECLMWEKTELLSWPTVMEMCTASSRSYTV